MKITRDSIITLLLFFFLTSVLYTIGYWLIFRTGSASPLMMSTGLAALLTYLIRQRKISSLGWTWGSWQYQWQSYLLPLAIIMAAYSIIWLCDFGTWYDTQFVLEKKASYNLESWDDWQLILFQLLFTASVSFMLALPSVLGEEIAWRGFLVKELSSFMSFTGVALVSGIIWSSWHWPLIISGLYGNSVTPLYYQIAVFSVALTSASMIMTYLRYKTNSLWTAVIFHMSWNVFMQKMFTPLTLANEKSAWYIDEFGIVVAVITAIVAAYFWKIGHKEFDKKKLISE